MATTQDEVSAACERIAAHGERPTVERVRVELGGGSPNAITPMVRTWKSIRQARDAPPPETQGQPAVEPGTLPVVVQRALDHLANAVAAVPTTFVAAIAGVAEMERRRSRLELEGAEAAAQQALDEARSAAADERSACDAVRTEASEAAAALVERDREIVTLREGIAAGKGQIERLNGAKDQQYLVRDEAEIRANVLADEVYEARKDTALARAATQVAKAELARLRAEFTELGAAANAARERVTSLTIEVAVERQRADGERRRAERAEAEAERARQERTAADAAALDAIARVALVEANGVRRAPADDDWRRARPAASFRGRRGARSRACIGANERNARRARRLDNEPPDGPLHVGMDGGYVRSREQGWFEAIAGKSLLSFHRDDRVPDRSGRCFAFIQTVDDKPRARLADTLRQQGMQPRQQVVFLSDGAETLRRLQQNIAPEAEHVLDWFHVTMRLTVLGQMIKGAWIDAVTVESEAAALDRIKWLLWHGNAPDAIDDIECLADDVAAVLEENPTSASLRKLATTLGEFATYITNNMSHLQNTAARTREYLTKHTT